MTTMPITPPPSDDALLRKMRSGSQDTAADTVQEAFMGLFTGRFAFDPLRGSLPNFLFGVARLLILKHEEPRRREAPLPEPDAALFAVPPDYRVREMGKRMPGAAGKSDE
jgi:DNA-directed RNA polymerase specialized sigma24 family protein